MSDEAPRNANVESLIGARVSALRTHQGITLEQLAARTGFSKGYLSKIENSRKVPPIGSLARIAAALRTDISEFLHAPSQAPDSGFSVVRAGERQPVVRGGTAFGYDYVSLAHQRLSKSMEPFVFTFPSKIDRHVFFDHGGEEFVFILSGKVIFQVGDERFTLEEGDSIYFDSAIPHRGWSVGRDAKALVVTHAARRPGEAAPSPAAARKRKAVPSPATARKRKAAG